MKKVLLFAVIAMFLMVPMSFAKTAITDRDLDSVTAQEGVVIVLDGVNVSNVSIAVQSWGDSDGFTDGSGNAYTHAGWVGANITMSGQVVSLSGVMTIDVGVSTNATSPYPGGVYIGLPTVTIGGGGDPLNITQVVKVGGEQTLSNAAGAMTMGTAYMGGLTAQITGNLMITTH
ncbi:MAG: hypothetical protein CVU55_06925 [Deltaproteobacteria bacterium HGW-Deltaproteobacteria-13]|jgi:hypothetical protein|nr:MAG: hypothetical protein CVU55_06925 [Deltaproteobacteria bacterium HGW-Deltaproteobacteria-13]